MTPIHVTPRRFGDSRGWFVESWNKARFEEWGITCDFVQDNHSLSAAKGTLRGLHFQTGEHVQAKLVRCLRGRVFDVAVDVRRDSPTFRQWVGVELSAERGNQLFVPPGYAHAFLTLEDACEVAYKVDAYYAPSADGGIAWNDPEVAIAWPLAAGELPLLSDKDAKLPTLAASQIDFPYDGQPMLPITD